MLYFKCISFTDNGNDIKADRGINTEMFDVKHQRLLQYGVLSAS